MIRQQLIYVYINFVINIYIMKTFIKFNMNNMYICLICMIRLEFNSYECT